MMHMLKISNLTKSYDNGFTALKNIDLEVKSGEIFALLGPNGAGKTTLISIICGLVNPTSGSVKVGGFDILSDYRKARSLIGLVPQEISLKPFLTVINSVKFTRGLFGKKPDLKLMEDILRKLSLWDKRDDRTMTLSGGMKRRLLIAKALYHEPRILFLDEPTAGVDVELRKDMWNLVAQLKADGVTIILTTHYIEEAEAIADRVGIIRDGELLMVEDKATLVERLGKRQLTVQLIEPLTQMPDYLQGLDLVLDAATGDLIYTYEADGKRTGIANLFSTLSENGIIIGDVQSSQSSLEDIMIDMLGDNV
ncbi:MAG: multidrug ABC transporter ATP-binding protein [Hyphomicrobiales bacterium]|nr:MAG: multidrug ABC transporter ATP-binding protein [Hyphomicrobiales bacterium]